MNEYIYPKGEVCLGCDYAGDAEDYSVCRYPHIPCIKELKEQKKTQ